MQVVILAAGRSSRFFPFSNLAHKSMAPIMGEPIIIHTIKSVKKSGVKDILLVVSPNSEIAKLLGDGSKFGIKITYIIQKEPTGAGNGLLLAEKKIKGNFFLLNASRLDFSSLKDAMALKKNNVKAVLLGKKQNKLGKYGVLKLNEDRVLDLIEKPIQGQEPSNIRLIGVYLFSKDFLNILRKTRDEHYRLERAISNLAKKYDVRVTITDKQAPSLKYSWDLLELKDYLLSNSVKSISKKAKIAKSAEVAGLVVIEDGVVVMEGAKIKGPCYIGKNSVVGNNVILREGVDVEESCVVGANAEIKNSLIMKNTKVHSGYVGDCVIGDNVRIGAGFNTANKRIDRGNISVISPDGDKLDTGLANLGAIIGSGVKIGIKASTMPGVIIGNDSVIGPGTTVLRNIPSDMKYYTKFSETIVRKIK